MRKLPWLWIVLGFLLAVAGASWYIGRVNSTHPAIWPMVGGDSSRRNFSALPLPQKAEVLWSYQLAADLQIRQGRTGRGQALTQPVVWKDGTTIVGYGTKVHAVGPDGKRKWAWESKTAIISLALGRRGEVYALADGMLYALNADGTQQWQVEVDVEIEEARDLVVGQGGTIYVSGREYLIAVTSTGERKWRFHGGRLSAGPVEMSDGKLLVMIRNQLYLLTREGDTVWEREATLPQSYLSLAAWQDRIYLTGGDRMVLTRESRTVSQVPNSGNLAYPAVGKDFIQSGLTRYDQNFDKQLWSAPTGNVATLNAAAAMSVVDAAGNAAVVTSDTVIRMFDAAGQLKWNLPGVQALLTMAPAGEHKLALLGFQPGKPGLHLIMVGDK